jgi:hypothetical protein
MKYDETVLSILDMSLTWQIVQPFISSTQDTNINSVKGDITRSLRGYYS